MRELARILVQGSEGKEERYHMQVSRKLGTPFCGAFETPISGLPFYDTLPQGCDAAWLLDPHLAALEAVIEANIPLIVADLAALPEHDRKKIAERIAGKEICFVRGLMVPGRCRLSTMPLALNRRGSHALMSSSKSLLYEAAFDKIAKGEGLSLCLLLGSSPPAQVQEMLQASTWDMVEG